MPVTVVRSPNAMRLTVSIGPEAQRTTFNLDMSLQRHAWRNLDQAQAKPMNSILGNAVTDGAIEQDLMALGGLLEKKLTGRAMFGDYSLGSGRTYRVDNSSPANQETPNHCYPIAGTGLWAGVSQAVFAAAVAFRRLELALDGKSGTPEAVWNSIKNDPTARTSEIYSAFTGARTHVMALEKKDRQKIVEAAGSSKLAIAISGFLKA